MATHRTGVRASAEDVSEFRRRLTKASETTALESAYDWLDALAIKYGLPPAAIRDGNVIHYGMHDGEFTTCDPMGSPERDHYLLSGRCRHCGRRPEPEGLSRAKRKATPMKIYLAGSSAELETCETWMRSLRDAGLEIATDWCAHIRANMSRGRTDSDLTTKERVRYAVSDLKGIADSDLVWLLAPEWPNTSVGCWVELGYAIGQGSIVVSGAHHRCIFAPLASKTFDTHEEAFAWIAEIGPTSARRRSGSWPCIGGTRSRRREPTQRATARAREDDNGD